VLAREITIARHLQESSAVTTVVIDDVEGVGGGLVCVLETIPFLGIEGAIVGWRVVNGFDSNVEGHGCRWSRDVGHGDVGVGAGIGFAVWVGGGVECGVVGEAGVDVAGVSAVPVRFEIVEAVGLHDLDFGVVLIGVGPGGIVDMPDE
jgi:hypothetical protein